MYVTLCGKNRRSTIFVVAVIPSLWPEENVLLKSEGNRVFRVGSINDS